MINETSRSRGLVPRVDVEGLDRTLDVPKGANLLRALRRENVNLHWTLPGKLFNCRGVGLCGVCRVRVVSADGSLPPRAKREERRLKGKPADWRLACYVEVRDDLRIEPFPLVPLEERLGDEAVRLARLSGEERVEWIETDRGRRREARRRAAEERLATRKRGLIARLIAKRGDKEKRAEDLAAPVAKKRGFGRAKKDKPPAAAKPKKAEAKPKKKDNAGDRRGLRFGKRRKDGDGESGGAA